MGNSSGVAHWLSQRTGHLAGCGAAVWSRLGEAQNPRGVGGRYGTRAGADDPQNGQRTPPLCQGARGKAAGVDTAVDRGGPVDRADTSRGQGAGRASRPCDAQRPHHTENDARSGQTAHPADRAVDHHRGGGQGQNRACWGDAGAGARAQQGGEEGRIWPAVSPESPRWGVCLWDVDPWGGGRVEDALTGSGGVPGDLWCAGHAHVGGLRPGRLCHSDREGAGPRGSPGDWHPAQRPRAVVWCRGRPRDGPERARQDRRDHWHPEDGQIGVQQAQGTSVADAGDGRSAVCPLVQSAQVDAGCGTGRQVRRKGMRSRRTEKTAIVERQEGDQEAPHSPQRSFATRSIYSLRGPFSIATGYNLLIFGQLSLVPKEPHPWKKQGLIIKYLSPY